MKPVRILTVVAVGCALLSAGCFGGAYTLASGNDSGSQEIVTREIPWDGSSSVTLDVAAVMRYVQAPGPAKIVARGPHRSVSTLTVTDGHIHDQLLHTGAVLEITLTAPSVTSFHVNGRSHLIVESFDQPALTITAQGSAEVTASGRAQHVALDMEGAGAVNLARLQTETISGSQKGVGTLIAAPQRRFDVDVEGLGSAVLLTRPSEGVHASDGARILDASRQ
jgi:hypothetical protein